MAATVAAVPAPTRKVPCEKCPLRGKAVLRDFTPEELAFIAEFKSGELQVEAGTTLFMQDANSAHLYTILSGWAFRYKTLPDGRRQILNYALPSDLIGLQGCIANEMQLAAARVVAENRATSLAAIQRAEDASVGRPYADDMRLALGRRK